MNLSRYTTYLTIILLILTHFAAISQNGNKRKIAIIGGGMAGVSAAHYLLENDVNADIVIFEKERSLGGNAQTIVVPNSFGDSVKVDIGPQFFTDIPWKEYILLLKRYGLVSADLLTEFKGTAVITKLSQEKPVFISPKGLSKRGEKIKTLKQFYRFHKSAHELYLSDNLEPLKVLDWVNALDLTEDFKQQIALPFLAASLGVTVNEVKELSAKEIVKLFAFRGPLERNTFYILNNGMGNAIKTIGDSIKAQGVEIKLSSEVVSVNQLGDKFSVKTATGEAIFDFVIFAVHPKNVSNMIAGDQTLNELKTNLDKFQVSKSNLVIHKDSTFGHEKKPSFLNIQTDAHNEVVSHTMDLGRIHKDFTGLYKSWLSNEDLAKVKLNGTVIATRSFEIQLITEQYSKALDELYRISSKHPNIYIAGGWSEGLESQETAVNSGEKAALKCRKFFDKLQ